ncbi:MAG: NAD(P)H-dependent oxidoreductase [Candidatus Omnitrophica bacterium]|nr:NAD(P)H-dependent oxidoreductase [Candidatus Omnitrophota bacterium]
MKIIIVYFSLTGNTKKLAVKIYQFLKSKNLEVSLFELESKEKKSFLRNCIEAIINKRVPIEKIPPIENYGCIAIGTPIWAGKIPPLVKSFIKEIDISNKNIFLFTTYKSGFLKGKAMKEFVKLIEEEKGKIIGKIDIKGKKIDENMNLIREEIEKCLKKL